MEFVIRPGRTDDIQRIAEMICDMKRDIDREAENNKPANWSAEKVAGHVKKRLSRTDQYLYLVAEHNKEIVGVIEANYKTNKRLYLMKGFVEPGFRGRGIMKQLDEHMLGIAGARGIEEIVLEVKTKNKTGLAAWAALGYRKVKVVDQKTGSKLIMKKFS